MGSSTRSRTPRQSHRQRLEVLETEAEQDEAIRALVELELADLDPQPDAEDEDDLFDSLDEDYQPIPWMPP